VPRRRALGAERSRHQPTHTQGIKEPGTNQEPGRLFVLGFWCASQQSRKGTETPYIQHIFQMLLPSQTTGRSFRL
jgi:hypothetical protein